MYYLTGDTCMAYKCELLFLSHLITEYQMVPWMYSKVALILGKWYDNIVKYNYIIKNIIHYYELLTIEPILMDDN